MANLVQELLIKIGIKSDTSGASQAGRAVEQIGNSAQKVDKGMSAASKSSKELTSSLGQGVEVGNATLSMMGNLETASKGGAQGLMAVGRGSFTAVTGLKGLIATAGPFGAWAAAIGVALGLMSLAFKKSEEAAAEAKKKVELLNKAKLDDVAKQHKDLKEAASDAMRAIDGEVAAMDKLADRRLAASIEETKAQGFAPEVEAAKITALRRQAEDQKLGREQSALDRKAEVANIASLEFEQKRIQADTERNMLMGVKIARDVARAEFADAYGAYQGAVKTGVPMEEQDALAGSLASARTRMLSTQAAYERRVGGKDKDGELYDSQLKTLDEAYQKATEAAKEAAKAAQSAKEAANAERKAQADLAPETKRLRAAEDKNAAGDNKVDQALVDRYRKIGQGAMSARWAGMDSTVDEAAFRAAFPDLDVGGIRRIGQADPGTGAVVKRGGGALPGDGQAAKGITEALKGTTEATKAAPTGDDTAKAAEELKAATEQSVQAQQAASEQTVAALSDLVGLNQSVVTTLTPIPGQISALRSEVQRLWGAVRAAQRKTNTA